jgi:xanthine dehydrogenase accessory factor
LSKEIKQIIEKLSSLRPNEKAVLATVVDVRGSSYRLPGAKMLITENGDTFGTVSGGCLEADVMERAKKVLKTGEASVFTYDTTKDENSVFSLNMGCRGVIRILLEPIKDESNVINFIEFAYQFREPQVIGTLISADSALNVQIGGRIFYSYAEQFHFSGFPDFLENLNELREDCLGLLDADNISNQKEYKTEQGTFEVFFENIKLPTSLLIFGAGADAIPLAEIGAQLGLKISVFDHRPAFLTAERFPPEAKLFPANAENYLDEIYLDKQTAAVIMTHNYERDRAILARLLPSDIFYLGALGPKRRTENLLQELNAGGEVFTAEQLEKLHAPVGLDIGAETPEAIALSIVAEIQAVLGGRNGGFLRERKGSIYGRN